MMTKKRMMTKEKVTKVSFITLMTDTPWNGTQHRREKVLASEVRTTQRRVKEVIAVNKIDLSWMGTRAGLNCLVFSFLLDELASDEDEINEDDVQYIEGLAQKVLIRIIFGLWVLQP